MYDPILNFIMQTMATLHAWDDIGLGVISVKYQGISTHNDVKIIIKNIKRFK